MDLDLTLALTIGLAVLAIFSGWRGSRPPNLMKGPRMMPWRFIMLAAIAGALMMLVHLLNLVGVTTGH
jgi:hypothetical protein